MKRERMSREQEEILNAGVRIASAIASGAPAVDYTPEELEEAKGRFSHEELEAVERYFCPFETYYVVCRFLDAIGEGDALPPRMLPLLCRAAKQLDKRAFRADPYLSAVKIPKDGVREGDFLVAENRYERGEVFQYEMPDFDEEFVVPRLGFFSSPVRFPAVYEKSVPWMSVCPSEISSMREDIDAAGGRLLVLGLGLGYYPFMASLRDGVSEITVIERSPEIKGIFEKHLLPQFPRRDKIKVVLADAFDALDAAEPDSFDFCYADIWEGAADGLPLYRRLKPYEKKFPRARFAYWIEKQLLAFERGS